MICVGPLAAHRGRAIPDRVFEVAAEVDAVDLVAPVEPAVHERHGAEPAVGLVDRGRAARRSRTCAPAACRKLDTSCRLFCTRWFTSPTR